MLCNHPYVCKIGKRQRRHVLPTSWECKTLVLLCKQQQQPDWQVFVNATLRSVSHQNKSALNKHVHFKTSAMHFYANFSLATLSGNVLKGDVSCHVAIVTHRKLGSGRPAGFKQKVQSTRAQPWVYCVGSACIIGEEWNVVTFTSLLSCHVVERQHQNALERLAPHFEFCQATQCNNGFSNWPCYLGSLVLNSWEPRLSHWPAVPGLRLQRTIKVPGLFKHYTWSSLGYVHTASL